ncbi:epoxyqueuosine reductase QueH [Candidatus Dependentiae bacterium]|nr:epoxyqueuosine reductase QueH [Candidatus Dependentiae bacterium]
MKKEKVKKEKILLHICCAPDATYPSELLSNNFEVIGYYYNPNMDSDEEDKKRFEETKKVSDLFKFELINSRGNIKDREEWNNAIAGLENLPEGGTRCFKCIEFRLKKTAEKAKEKNIKVFTTTLTVSPHKNAFLINSIGKNIAEKFNLEFLKSNFKKNNGLKKTLEYSKEFNLYRQKYCGCIFSKRRS